MEPTTPTTAPAAPAGLSNPFTGLVPDFSVFGGDFTTWWQKLFVGLWALCLIVAAVYLLTSLVKLHKATNNNIPGQADEAKTAAAVGRRVPRRVVRVRGHRRRRVHPGRLTRHGDVPGTAAGFTHEPPPTPATRPGLDRGGRGSPWSRRSPCTGRWPGPAPRPPHHRSPPRPPHHPAPRPTGEPTATAGAARTANGCLGGPDPYQAVLAAQQGATPDQVGAAELALTFARWTVTYPVDPNAPAVLAQVAAPGYQPVAMDGLNQYASTLIAGRLHLRRHHSRRRRPVPDPSTNQDQTSVTLDLIVYRQSTKATGEVETVRGFTTLLLDLVDGHWQVTGHAAGHRQRPVRARCGCSVGSVRGDVLDAAADQGTARVPGCSPSCCSCWPPRRPAPSSRPATPRPTATRRGCGSTPGVTRRRRDAARAGDAMEGLQHSGMVVAAVPDQAQRAHTSGQGPAGHRLARQRPAATHLAASAHWAGSAHSRPSRPTRPCLPGRRRIRIRWPVIWVARRMRRCRRG